MKALTNQLGKYLNYFLEKSPTAIEHLKKLEGKSFKLLLKGIDEFFILKIVDGEFSLNKEEDERADVYLEAFPSDLLFVLLRGPDNFSTDDIYFKGNVTLLNDLAFIMRALYPDLYEILEPVVGRVIATEVSNMAQQAMLFRSSLHASLRRNVEEYLKEEIQVLPTDIELQTFYKEVISLRDGVERIQQEL
jgi:ubiquinone biosynthesis protein UbiJ